jgi:hypothetical protein
MSLKVLEQNPDFITIKAWFDERSYIISDAECIRILENKDRYFQVFIKKIIKNHSE